MAQASSVAREPSMEEILASIRRIIEDSDAGSSRPEQESGLRGAVAEFRRPLPSEEASTIERDPSVKATSAHHDFPNKSVLRGPVSESPTSASQSRELLDDEDDIILDAQNDDHRLTTAAPSEAEDKNVAISETEIEQSLDTGIAEAMESFLDTEPEKPSALMPPRTEPVIEETEETGSSNEVSEEEMASVPHILSQAVERQVSEAFADLNHAVHSAPRRSFDDIATELLRPMLHEWLDNNLPPLVERLVREEIERVVRGNQCI
ncbi:PopZ family protein [Brucella sp. BE17]|uniref:PopZ family protein n=1 Tax=Brucella sp. BE17 TaxID=3142977 RepID=UPI0031BA4349